MPQEAKRSATWTGRITWVLLAGLVAMAAVGAVGSGDRSSDTDPAGGQETLPVTDTTAPASDAVQGSSEDSVAVTDTTVARQWPPETDAAQVAGAQSADTQPAPTVATAPAATSTTLHWSIPPRTRHPTWDSRLPGTWEGLLGTDCHDTFSPKIQDPAYAWHFYYDITGGVSYGKDESEVIGLAFKDPTFEPARGTELHTALINLGLPTAQDIRNLGDDAINVRWYAWWVKDRITPRGNVNHPSCASILAGADAVLSAPLITTTTTIWVTDTTAPAPDGDIWVTDTTVARQWPPETDDAAVSEAQSTVTRPAPTVATAPAVTSTTLHWSIPPRTRHPTWDSRLPGDWDGLPGTDCHDTFRTSVLSVPYAWHAFYDETGGVDYGKDESEVIGLAFKNSSFEPARGTELHTALINLGLSTAQDIRNLGDDAINVRWYAWWVKDRITLRGDVNHPSCASILAGAEAVLNAPLVTTTTTASP